MVLSRLIFVRSFLASTSSWTSPSRKVLDKVVMINMNAPFKIAGAVAFTMSMATVVGYGCWRSNLDESDRIVADREAYLRYSRNSEDGSGVKHHEVLKRYLEEGRVAELFQIWKEQKKKVYKDAEEENERIRFFESKLKWIVENNPNCNYGLVLNHNCDRSTEEYERLFPKNCVITAEEEAKIRELLLKKIASLQKQAKSLQKGNLSSFWQMIKSRVTSPGTSLETTCYANNKGYLSTTSKNTLFSTLRPNIDMPNAPMQSSPRPLQDLNSLRSRGNSSGIAGLVDTTKNSGPKNSVPVGGQNPSIPWYKLLHLNALDNTTGMLNVTSNGFPVASEASGHGMARNRK